MQKFLTMRGLATYIFLFCSFSVLIITSRGADTIAANTTIKDGETLISTDGTYEMGFFSIPNSSNLRYFGIWYYKIPTDRIVWVANRNTPIRDTSGFLNFDEMGILTLNHNNSVIWSSNTSRQANNPVAQLLDSGNLIVRNQNENRADLFLWESFHEPGNTFLPGMKIGRSADGFFTYNLAWKTTDDPTEGDYILALGPSGLELEIRKNSTVTARSGAWNGIGFSGVPHLRPNPLFTYDFVYNAIEMYYSYELINASVITKLVLNPNGVWERRTWVDRTNEWVIYSTSPADICDNYKLCGAYGTCTIGNLPVCGCLSGFVTRNKYNWDRADWSDGCVRRTALDCKGDGFVRYSNIKLPDMKNFSRNASMTLEECRTKCLNDCSCTGYANADIRRGGSGCLLWYGDLIDIKQYRTDGQDLYIRMAASEIAVESRTRSKVGLIVGVVLSATLLLSLGLCLLIWKKKKKKKKKKRDGSVEAPEEMETVTRERSMSYQDEDMDLPHYELSALSVATDNFSFSNMIGEGGYGPVYKGTLEDGLEIAVKRLSRESKQGVYEFKNEVKCIAKLQHRNLVKLLGYCIQMEENILIYEYMPNKSLDYYICDKTRKTLLDWNMRLRIINGISRGLLYLHQDSRLRIIHRDLKLSNILLDKEMNPKISDFGLARSFGGNETAGSTKRVVGTYGYMSPEYTMHGLFSIKSDVFSFGVLVLEIVSGKRNWGFSHGDLQLNLVGHAWKLYKEGRSTELIDASIEEPCNLSELLRSIQIGLLCVQHSPEHRPTMALVVMMLSGTDGPLPEPKEPGFFTERNLVDRRSSSTKAESCSVNEVTITMMDGR